jgi:hypothetical protein
MLSGYYRREPVEGDSPTAKNPVNPKGNIEIRLKGKKIAIFLLC